MTRAPGSSDERADLSALTGRGRRAAIAALLATASGLFATTVTDRARSAEPRIPEANGSGMDLHLFRPPLDSKGLASVNGADVLGAWDWALGLFVDYGHDFMDLNPGHGDDVLVEHAFQGTLMFNLGFVDLFEIGISGPVTMNAGGGVTDTGPTGATYDSRSFNQESLGFFGIHTKFKILSPQDVIGVAVAAQIGIAAGDTAARSLAGEPSFFYWPQIILEKQWFYPENTFRLAFNAGYRGHVGDATRFGLGLDGLPQLAAGVLEYGDLVTAGLGASYRVVYPLDLFAETYMSALVTGDSDGGQRVSAEAIGGIKLHVEERSFLFIAGGAGYTPGFQAAGQRAVLGFVFEPSIVDTDGDGIPDDEDDCPNDPEDKDGFQDTREDSPDGEYGCPDPDNDQDGIPDDIDACPDQPEDMDGDRDQDGCPEVASGDRDGDGIIDALDKCPDVPESKNGIRDNDGCPEEASGDKDGDGYPDEKDECPNEPEDFDNFEDNDGCPDPDNDEDGILDSRDKCPDEPEDMDGDKDEDGCPDDAKIVFTGKRIVALEKIQFATGSTRILPTSMPIVVAVADVLKKNPKLEVLEVGGHADERGDDKMNLNLTNGRAKSVLQALVQRGIQAKRLRSVGYGEYCPIDDRANAEAWEKNRRVEFKVLVTNGSATGVEQGCAKAREMGIDPPKP